MSFLKSVPVIFLLFLTTTTFSQERVKAVFGEPSLGELNMSQYDPDPEASAVVLFESANNRVELVGDYLRLVKEVHRKIKVLNPKDFKHSTVQIPLYKQKNISEKLAKIKAITHNGETKTYLVESAIFSLDITTNWVEKRFTFPNIKKGSVLEYTYRIESPYFFNFDDWKFQGDLPKVYSELYAEIPGNYSYNRVLYGNEKLYINDVSLKEDCLSVPGLLSNADCEAFTYAMKDVPAYREEPYMLSKKNYMARVSFELEEIIDFRGTKETFSKEWKDVDNQIRYDKYTGKELKHTGFFQDYLPPKILAIPDQLEKAKAVYKFVQKNFTWNGNYRVFSDIDVKEAFEKKEGNITEINLALINALNAAELDAKIVLLSTRENGLPALIYPVLSDFNYIVALLTLGNNKYILDATDRDCSFESLPYRTLNVQGRVMDFKKGSYWHPIDPNPKNVHYINAQFEAEEEGRFSGKVTEVFSGHIGVNKRKAISGVTKSEYINTKTSKNPNLEIENFQIENIEDSSQPIKEDYTVFFDTEIVGDNVYLYPLFVEPYFDENPFKAESRQYPIDFGFPVTNMYLISINLNGKYEVIDLPKSRAYKMPEHLGECSIIYSNQNDKVNLKLSVKLNEFRFESADYSLLKEFFSNIFAMQNKEPIVLKNK